MNLRFRFENNKEVLFHYLTLCAYIVLTYVSYRLKYPRFLKDFEKILGKTCKERPFKRVGFDFIEDVYDIQKEFDKLFGSADNNFIFAKKFKMEKGDKISIYPQKRKDMMIITYPYEGEPNQIRANLWKELFFKHFLCNVAQDIKECKNGLYEALNIYVMKRLFEPITGISEELLNNSCKDEINMLDVKKYIEPIRKLDKGYVLFFVFIRELWNINSKEPVRDIQVEEILYHMMNRSKRKRDEPFKVSIGNTSYMLLSMANRTTIEKYNLKPYKNQIKLARDKKIKTVYIVANGESKIIMKAKKLVKIYKKYSTNKPIYKIAVGKFGKEAYTAKLDFK